MLDRFRITGHLNQALDQVRRAESGRLRGQPLAKRLKKMRWHLLKRGSRVRGRARVKLEALLASKLARARAWNLKDTFEYFWHYKSPLWAAAFLDYWTSRAMRSRLEPLQGVVVQRVGNLIADEVPVAPPQLMDAHFHRAFAQSQLHGQLGIRLSFAQS